MQKKLNPMKEICTLNKLDPRTRLLLAVFYTILIVASRQMSWMLSQYGVLVLFIISIGRIKYYLTWLRMILPMAIFFGLVTWWSIDQNSAYMAFFSLMTITTVFFAFFITTTPEDLGSALVKTGMPYYISFIFSASLQFVPILTRKAKNIFDAQRARGIPLESKWSIFRHIPVFLGPLLIQSFKLADELAEAMETRGFSRTNRTFLKDYRMRAIDWIALSLSILMLLFCLHWQG
ncbi:MAG: energy-coupling factor transporter transmembrane protein EcfT [Desulfobacterales bacterium]|nr:energy-coupling factor transporter transmembrane protein EcfT [Desulfobacterales bacterium]